jgi:outer membrane protein assembly complex protein YaeT
VERLADALAALYYEAGWLRVRVEPPRIEVDREAGTATAVIPVEEGPRFVLLDVNFAGDQVLGAELLANMAAPHVGAPYRPDVAFAIRGRVVAAHDARAHPDVVVEFVEQLDEDTGEVRLELTMEPGPRVVLGDIEVEGAEQVPEHLIRRRLGLEPGTAWNAEEVRKGFRRLYRTGLFDAVDVELAEAAEDGSDRRDVIVRVEEAPSRELRVVPGWGSYEGPRLALGITERTFLGTGRELSFDGSVSPKDQRGELRWVDPWLIPGDFTTSLRVFAGRRIEPSFTHLERGAGLGVAQRWTEDLTGNADYRYRNSKSEDVKVGGIGNPPQDDVIVSSLSYALNHRTTREFFSPDDGSRSTISVEWSPDALGSTLPFLATRLAHSRYFRMGPTTVLAVSGRTNLKVPSDAEPLPIQERLFNGGENSVRSFKESKLGPKDANGNPIGGETTLTFNVEARQDLISNLEGALFVDAGNVEVDSSEYFDLRGFGYGVGVGLRYLLPVGHLRLDAAVNPDPDPQDDTYVVHFSIGMAF